MKCIIAGPRDCQDYKLLCEALENCPFTDEITEVISGGATGIDRLGEKWGKDNGKKVTVMKAKWKEIELPGAKVVEGKYGPYNSLAGFWRNKDMAEYAGPDGGCVAIDLGTPGTDSMIDLAGEYGLRLHVWPQRAENPLKRVYDF
jgi:hypothetical protein